MNIAKEKPEEFKMFQEFWELHCKYYHPTDFDRLFEEVTEQIEKYKDTDFGMLNHDLMHLLLEDCDRKAAGRPLTYDFEKREQGRKIAKQNIIREFLLNHKGETVNEILEKGEYA